MRKIKPLIVWLSITLLIFNMACAHTTGKKTSVKEELSDAGKRAANAYGSALLNNKLSTLIMGHVEDNSQKDDFQNDGFLDHPLVRQYNLLNRWYYTTEHFHIPYIYRWHQDGHSYTYNSAPQQCSTYNPSYHKPA